MKLYQFTIDFVYSDIYGTLHSQEQYDTRELAASAAIAYCEQWTGPGYVANLFTNIPGYNESYVAVYWSGALVSTLPVKS